MLVLLEGRGLVKSRTASRRRPGARESDGAGAATVRQTMGGQRAGPGQLLAGLEPHEIETLVTLLHRVIANVSLPQVRSVMSGQV